jgi:hypothetical protein
MRRGWLRGGTCVWRIAESDQGHAVIAMGMLFDWILRPCIKYLYKHLVVDVTVTSARTNFNIPAVGSDSALWQPCVGISIS